MSDIVAVMRTGHLYKLDMADCALKDADIPHYTREETSSGMRLAMPAAPSMGPGVSWSILVPRAALEEAQLVLGEMPFEITTEIDVWDSQPDPAKRRIWLIGCRILAVIFIGTTIAQMIEALIRATAH